MKDNPQYDVKKVQAMGQFLSLYSSPTGMDAPIYSPSANANSNAQGAKVEEEVKDTAENADKKVQSPKKTPASDPADMKGVNNAAYVAALDGTASQKPPIPTNASNPESEQESEEKEKSGVSALDIAQGDGDPNSAKGKTDGEADSDGPAIAEVRALINYVLEFANKMQGILNIPDTGKEKKSSVDSSKGKEKDKSDKESKTFTKVDIGPSNPDVDSKSPVLPEKGKSLAEKVGLSSKKSLDTVVDPYMESNWDRKDYDKVTSKYNVVPSNVGTFMDSLLPPGISPEVRYSANLVYSMATGALDITYLSAMAGLPVVGLIGGPVYAFRDMINAAGSVPDLDNSWWDEGIVAMEILRGGMDIVNNFLGGVEGTLTLAQYIMTFFGGAAGGLVGGVGGTAVAPVAGTAAGAGAGAGAGGATGNVGGGFAQSPVVIAQLSLQSAITVCDMAMTLMSLAAEGKAQEQGEMGKAKAFGELAEAHAFKSAADALGVVITAGFELISAGNAPSAIVGTAAKKASGKSFKELIKIIGKETGENIGKNFADKGPKNVVDKGNQVPGKADWWNEMQVSVGGGDVLRGEDPFVNPNKLTANGDAAALLSSERDKTVTTYEASWENLKSDDPEWHQNLINTILFPESASNWAVINQLMVPSGWLELILGGARDLGTAFPSLMQNLKADAIKGFADLLDGDIQDFINWMIQTIAEQSDLEKDLDEINEIVENQRLTLEFLRTSMKSLEETLAKVSEAVQIGPEVETGLNKTVEQLQGMKLTREALNIPEVIPDFLVQQLLAPYNKVVDDLIANIKQKIAEIRQIFNDQIKGMEKLIQQEIDEIQEIIKDGGKAEKVFISAQDELAKQVSEFLKFASKFMSGGFKVDFSGFSETLRAIADKAEQASHDHRWKDFVEYLKNDAQQSVDDWKGKHSDEVHMIFYPVMPKNEIAALEKANKLLTDRLQIAEIGETFTTEQKDVVTKQLGKKYSQAKSLVGSKGQENIQNFWKLLNEIAKLKVPVKEVKKKPDKEKEKVKEKKAPEEKKAIIHEVVKKNNLWKLADHYYGNPHLYKKIHEANLDKIKDPHWIYPGQKLVIPRLPSLKKEFQ